MSHALKPALRHWARMRGRAAPAGGAPGFEFDSGTLAGEIERLSGTTTLSEHTLTVDGNSLDVEYYQYDSNLTISANTDFGSATADQRMVCVRVTGNLTIDSDVTVSTPSRKLGLVFFVTGDVQIDGTLDMTARGANHGTSGSNIVPFDLLILNLDMAADGIVPSAGGAGGAALGGTAHGLPGIAGSNGGTGGGGGGARNGGGTSGAGAAGTLWTGGTGGGAAAAGGTGGSGVIRGGKGGDGALGGTDRAAGGGAGNPGGAGVVSGSGVASPGDDGTGGLIAIICLGAIAISATGIVRANGSNGGDTSVVSFRAGGGGSGGGTVNLYRRGIYTNDGTAQANGGVGGVGGVNGGAGGAGSVRSVAI